MKQLFVFLLLIAGLASCKSQEDTLQFTDEFMLQVANDPLFKAYQETVHIDAENIVLDKYVMEAIGKIFDEIPFGENICLSDSAKEKFLKTRGGNLYLANDCKRNELVQKLDDKFNYSSFPDDISEKIILIYREVNRQEIKQRAINLYNKKTK